MTWKRSRRARSCSRSPGRPRRWQTNRARPPPPRPLSGPDRISPKVVGDLRERLTKGEDVVDPEAWAGSIPAAFGIAPRLRIGANRWFNLLWLLPIGLGPAAVASRGGAVPPRAARASKIRPPPSRDRLRHHVRHRHAGLAARAALPEPVPPDLHHPRRRCRSSPTIPGCTGRGTRRPGRSGSACRSGCRTFRSGRPSRTRSRCPKHVGLPGIRHSIGLARWWHLGVDVLWLANGLIFYVLLFATGEWRRIVPTSWQVFPDAASVLLQYLSLQLARGRQLGRVQRPPDPRLLHHGLHRRAARARDRARHVARALDPVPAASASGSASRPRARCTSSSCAGSSSSSSFTSRWSSRPACCGT